MAGVTTAAGPTQLRLRNRIGTRTITVQRPRCLALRGGGLGDLLTAVPALRALARAYPDHVRLVAVPAPLAPLALHTGAVHAVVPTGPALEVAGRVGHIDIAVDLHGAGPDSHRALLALRPSRLVAHRCPGVHQDDVAPHWTAGGAERERWIRLLEAHGIPGEPEDLAIDDPRRPVRPWARGATLLHVGAGAGAGHWPIERWAQVARAEVDCGREVVLTGTAAEQPLVDAVRSSAGLPPDVSVAGTTDVLALASYVAAAGRVVCGDTGVGHLATALGTPSVLLSGPSSPAAPALDPGPAATSVDDVMAALADVASASAGDRPVHGLGNAHRGIDVRVQSGVDRRRPPRRGTEESTWDSTRSNDV